VDDESAPALFRAVELEPGVNARPNAYRLRANRDGESGGQVG
jgi:hypothetical protein